MEKQSFHLDMFCPVTGRKLKSGEAYIHKELLVLFCPCHNKEVVIKKASGV